MASMTQLSYQPAFDPYHAIYRFLRLRNSVFANQPVHKDQARILDYYLLFPFRIEDIKLKRPHLKYKKLAKQLANTKPYGELPDDRILFGRMQPLQIAAFDTLAGKRLIDPKKYETGTVTATQNSLSEEIAARIEADNEAQRDLVEFMDILVAEYPLLGSDGLKDRTGLMEHRYDAI